MISRPWGHKRSMDRCTFLVACRICGRRDLSQVLDLGVQPLANNLPPLSGAVEPLRFPLTLMHCRACGLLQLRESVAPDLLFSEYLYFSSFSGALLQNARHLASSMVDRLKLGARDLVVDVGSNDGYLLRHYKELGVRVLGIEPARNVAAEAERQHGIPSLARFFSPEVAEEVRERFGEARVVHANNVMAHVPDLHGFTEGLRVLLGEDGEAVVEVAYAPEMIAAGTFDMIYHEHVCYYTVRTLSNLLSLHALDAVDVDRIATHGGSIRLYAAHAGRRTESQRLRELRAWEDEEGVHDGQYVECLAARSSAVRRKLRELLAEHCAGSGRAIAVYGVAAKATVLLNSLDLPRGTLSYAVDKNPAKQNRRLPGPDIPIRSPRVLEEDPPGLILITAWNLAEEILKDLGPLRERGTKFLVPFPMPHFV